NYGGRFNVIFTPNTRNQLSAGFFAGHKFQDRVADLDYDNVTTEVGSNTVIGRHRYFNAHLQNKHGDFILGNLDYSHTFSGGTKLGFSTLYEHAGLHGSTLNGNIAAADTTHDTVSTYGNPLDGFRGKVDLA